MLDRAESSYLPHILKANPELKNIYSGFTYYPNTVSFNGHTLMGSPGIYGGYEYTPYQMNQVKDKSLLQKHNESLLVLPRILTENADYSANVYDLSWANYSYEADMSITNDYDKINGGILCGRYTGDIKKTLSSYDSSLLTESVNRNLFFVSLFREVPAVLRDIIYYKGTWWCSEVVSDEDSFTDVQSWLNDVKQNSNRTADSDISLFLLANKIDKEDRKISREKGEELAKSLGMKYFEISCKNNINVHETMARMIMECYKRVSNTSNTSENIQLSNQKGGKTGGNKVA